MYKKQFQKLIELIKANYDDANGLHPYKLSGIYNKTAAKYIKLLLDIQHSVES